MGPVGNLLAEGDMEVLGRLPWSSNATFLVEVVAGDLRMRAVYKPGQGERPLWDYPPDLYRRERAAYLISEILGWGLVPETVLRDGTFGDGAVQRFVAADFAEQYFSIVENARHHDALQAIGLFDLLINNGDRKGGHVLAGYDGPPAAGTEAGPPTRIWAVDHGLCLHAEPKLRTVIWDFARRALPASLLPDVARLRTELAGEAGRRSPATAELAELLEGDEIAALDARAGRILDHPIFPPPRSGRSYPWPLV